MDILAWIGWALLTLLWAVWALVWFVISGWVATLVQIALLIAVLFFLKYGWQRAPGELLRRGRSLGRFAWSWVRAKDAQTALSSRGEVREVVRVIRVKEPGDITGLKLRSTGGAQDLTLRAIGAVPVRMAAPDAYESLQRGTMDGLLFPLESVVAYGADKLVKFSTDGLGFASFVVAYSISDNVWKKLSPEIQKAMSDAADEIIPSACEQVQKSDDEVKKSMEAQGVKFETLSADTKAKLKDLMKGVNKSWAEALDARGKKGSDALREFEAGVAAVPVK